MESLLGEPVPVTPRRSLPPSEGAPPGRVFAQHVCQFYETPSYLYDVVGRFVSEGLDAGELVVVVAEPDHLQQIARRVDGQGASFAEAVASGRLVTLDVSSTLARLMVDGTPDRDRFREIAGGLLDAPGTRAPDRPVRIFGEMVDALWRDGNPAGALRLEALWNELAESRPFHLLCGYPMGSFSSAAHESAFGEVCAQHARVIPADVLGPDGAARERGIALLQQRARALDTERQRTGELEAALRQALEERARTEAALLEARNQAEQAARAKSEFLTLVSHELRTPLNGVLGYQDLLEHGVGGQLSAEQRAYLSRMRSCSEQLLRLIDQVLTLSHVETPEVRLEPELFDAVALVRDTASLVESGAFQRGLSLQVTGPSREIALWSDRVAVRQILLHLITNAVKFTDTGSVRVHVRRVGEAVAFQVADTGVGIRPQDRERIFEPFVQLEHVATRRHGGSGLGLAVSRDLARRLGGDLVVEEEPGGGSRFSLTLPLAAPVRA